MRMPPPSQLRLMMSYGYDVTIGSSSHWLSLPLSLSLCTPPLLSSRAPTSGRLLPPMGLGVGHPSAFGVPYTPITIRCFRIGQLCAATCCYLLPPCFTPIPLPWVHSLVFMSFSHCAFFYCSFFFSLDFPSLIFVFGAAHLSFLVSCGGVVS